MPPICMENKIICKLTTKRVALLIRATFFDGIFDWGRWVFLEWCAQELRYLIRL